jgi:phage terminase large subunit-like protein
MPVTTSWAKPRTSTAGLNLPKGAYYDEEAADRAVAFFGLLNLVEGKGAGKPWELLPWMEYELIRPLFGYKRANGSRLYRTVWVELPRKNAKTTCAAGIALYCLVADGEAAPQVIIGARDRQQAKLCFDLARKMVAGSPALAKRCRAVRSYIEHPKSGGVLRAVSADAAGQHGLGASCVIVDEVHAHRDRELWDVLATSTGAREQPIVMGITTAGVYDPHSIAWEQHTYAEMVASGELQDPYFLAVIYGADLDADWQDPAVWAQANPSLDVAISSDYLREEVARAQVSPARQTTFRQLHLNIWTSEVSRWIDPEAWDRNSDEARPVVAGEPCFAGLDLSSTTDISALVLLRPDPDGEKFDVHPFFWIPEADIVERERRDRLPYREWVAAGFVQLTNGNIVDYAVIRNKIVELADTFGGFTLGYDPWNATGLVTELMGAGLTCVPVRQGFATLSAPTKELERLILGERLRHGGNPVLKAHAGAALVQIDAAGNLKPDKAKSGARIDGLIALVMALHSSMLAGGGSTGRSVYEERGIEVL